jgi:hypothetical protein
MKALEGKDKVIEEQMKALEAKDKALEEQKKELEKLKSRINPV